MSTSQKPRRGRPPVAEPAAERVELRITASALAEIDRAAEDAGMGRSEWIRTAAASAAKASAKRRPTRT